MAVTHGSIGRSLAHLTFGALRDVEKRRAAVADDKLQEVFQHFQVAVSGRAAAAMTWETKTINFDVHFFAATGQRDNPYDRPQVTSGFVLTPVDDKAPPPSIVVQTFIEWLEDESQTTTGCILHVGAYAPGGTGEDFDGEVHLSFQGYGASSADRDGKE